MKRPPDRSTRAASRQGSCASTCSRASKQTTRSNTPFGKGGPPPSPGEIAAETLRIDSGREKPRPNQNRPRPPTGPPHPACPRVSLPRGHVQNSAAGGELTRCPIPMQVLVPDHRIVPRRVPARQTVSTGSAGHVNQETNEVGSRRSVVGSPNVPPPLPRKASPPSPSPGAVVNCLRLCASDDWFCRTDRAADQSGAKAT